MNVLSWNCIGAGSKEFCRNMGELIALARSCSDSL